MTMPMRDDDDDDDDEEEHTDDRCMRPTKMTKTMVC